MEAIALRELIWRKTWDRVRQTENEAPHCVVMGYRVYRTLMADRRTFFDFNRSPKPGEPETYMGMTIAHPAGIMLEDYVEVF